MADELTASEREELEQLRKEKETRGKRGEIFLKVSQKGAVSLYGLGRFPVTLYKEQWERILGSVELIKGFIKENEAALSVKNKD
ncbi:MAG: hypothetical protein JNM63_04475 [Spirochaetia bacterium]|nr:hypothetical protein [Spirochaetia bacterium]